MHGARLLSAAKRTAHTWHECVYCALALSPEADDFLHSPENFCTLLPIPTLLKFSIKTTNYIER
jgi:hypothetical protein